MSYSKLTSKIHDYIIYRETNGYNTESIKYHLNSFNNYLIKKKYEKEYITKEITDEYLDNLNNISNNTKSGYASIIRQFGLYLNRFDDRNGVISLKKYPRNKDFYPHIYTNEEINKIFDSIKNGYYKTKPKIQKQLYLIVKLLFSTGMRINEVLTIKIENIDFDSYSIYLEKTKNNTDRLIVIDEILCNQIKEFMNECKSKFNYLFERNYQQLYTPTLFNAYFRRILFFAKIKHTETGPRVHDIRHTFAVNSFRNAIKNGENISYFVPILSAYLGHKSIDSTYKYLHLTSETFPNLRNQIEKIIKIDKEIDYDNL